MARLLNCPGSSRDGRTVVKRAALYVRVSTLEQRPETQLHELKQLAEQRGLEIADVYTDHGISGTRVKRPALDRLLVSVRISPSRIDLLRIKCCF